MVKVNLNKVLQKTTFDVFKDIVYYNSTYRVRQRRLNLGLNAIYYQIDKLIGMGLVEKDRKGKLISLIECPYCSKVAPCKGAYPEGCFLEHEISYKFITTN